MDFNDVCDFLDGVPFYDDLHIDFTAVHLKLQKRSHDNRSSSISQTKSVDLLRAILLILEGEFEPAARVLVSLRSDARLSSGNSRWIFRANIYSALLCVRRDFPPLLQPCELRGPALKRWMSSDDYDDGSRFLLDCRQVQEQMSDLDRFELGLVTVVYQLRWSSVWFRRLNRSLPDYDMFTQQFHVIGVLAKQLYDNISALERDVLYVVAEDYFDVFPRTMVFLLMLKHDLTRACEFPNPLQCVAKIKKVSEVVSDYIGLGQYCLAIGDWTIAPCFTSPSFLNLSIIDDMDECGGDSTMYFANNITFNCRSASQSNETLQRIQSRISAATLWYDKAREHFQSAASPRGLAMATLRKACILRMLNMQPAMTWNLDLNLWHTKALLGESLSYARQCGDKELQDLITIQQIGCQGLPKESILQIHQIALRAREAGNIVFSLGLALFTMRTGYYARYVTGSMLGCFEGFEICVVLIEGLQHFCSITHHAMIAQCRLAFDFGNRSHIVTQLRDIKEMHDAFMYGCTSGKNSQWGLEIVLPVLVAIVDTVVLLGPPGNVLSDFPDSMTKNILWYLDLVPDMRPFVRNAWARLRHASAVTSYRRHVQEGDHTAARAALISYLEETDEIVDRTLQERLFRIEFMCSIRYLEGARKTLDRRVSDTDLLPARPRPPFREGNAITAIMQRSISLRAIQSIEAIFLTCVKAEHWQRAHQLMGKLERASPGYFTSVTSYTNLWPWQRCLYAGLVLESRKQYHEAFLYFAQARHFLYMWSSSTLDEHYRQLMATPEVARLMGSIARRALLWRFHQPNDTALGPTTNPAIDRGAFRIFDRSERFDDLEQHPVDALQLLEAARPQYTWSNHVNGMTHEQAEAQYKYELWEKLSAKSDRDADEEAEVAMLHSEINKNLDIHLESRSLRRETYKLLRRSVRSSFDYIPEDALVLYIYVTEDGCLFLVIARSEVVFAAFKASFPLSLLESGVIEYVDAIKTNNTSLIELWCDRLSGILIEPFDNCIDSRTHMIFVLNGILTRMPIGALKWRGEHLILKRAVSQVPSLMALQSLRARQAPQGPPKISVIARPGSVDDGWLPMAGIEAMSIATMCGTVALSATDISRSTFRRLLAETQLLHICTHGVHDANDPFNSHIFLAHRLRVLDMLAIKGNISLVTFSACLAGAGNASDAGDVQGFSHAVLAAGAHAYVGALWKVRDITTMIHMKIFYATLFLINEEPSFAEAWQFATQILYNLTTRDAITYLEHFVACWDYLEGEGEDPATFAGSISKRKLQRVIARWKAGKETVDFKEPRVWAPFVMVGNASLQISTNLKGLAKDQSRWNSMAEYLGLKEAWKTSMWGEAL